MEQSVAAHAPYAGARQLHETLSFIKYHNMKKNIFYWFIFAAVTLISCNKDDNSLPIMINPIKQVIITARENINSNTYESTSVFDYLYENNKIKEIIHEGKTHISFNYRNENVVEKKYFNNLEKVISIDSFIYDQDERLTLIKCYNNFGDLILNKELSYNFNQLSFFKETFFYPTTTFQEYEFIYSGSNIDSVIFLTANQTYKCDYFEDENYQNLNWFIENMGLYNTGQFAINGSTFPRIFSSNRIKSLHGVNSSGDQTFKYEYKYLVSNDKYDEFHYEWFDENQELLSSYQIEFKY